MAQPERRSHKTAAIRFLEDQWLVAARTIVIAHDSIILPQIREEIRRSIPSVELQRDDETSIAFVTRLVRLFEGKYVSIRDAKVPFKSDGRSMDELAGVYDELVSCALRESGWSLEETGIADDSKDQTPTTTSGLGDWVRKAASSVLPVSKPAKSDTSVDDSDPPDDPDEQGDASSVSSHHEAKFYAIITTVDEFGFSVLPYSFRGNFVRGSYAQKNPKQATYKLKGKLMYSQTIARQRETVWGCQCPRWEHDRTNVYCTSAKRMKIVEGAPSKGSKVTVKRIGQRAWPWPFSNDLSSGSDIPVITGKISAVCASESGITWTITLIADVSAFTKKK